MIWKKFNTYVSKIIRPLEVIENARMSSVAMCVKRTLKPPNRRVPNPAIEIYNIGFLC